MGGAMRDVCVILLFLLGPLAQGRAAEPVLRPVFERLDQIRSGKEAELGAYFARMQKLADSILADEVMQRFFRLQRDLHASAPHNDLPGDLKQALARLDASMQQHYLQHYMAFYDILCIDREGDIFYSVRKEDGARQNVFEGPLASTALSRHLKASPGKTLVDYQFYRPAGEPSAFFVEPVKDGEQLLGWFVLQCAINKVNRMFSQHEDLGRTGEVILVNRQRYMLTDSRFFGESSILKRHLSPENIHAKFKLGRGHRIVTDYRGHRAITTFSTVDVGSAKWLAIAKIDEDEVVSNLYRQMLPGSRRGLLAGIAGAPLKAAPEQAGEKPFVRVDMDEFQRAEANEGLLTYGVSTCTAAVFTCPGKFSYLTHLSVHDKMYGNSGTDLLGNVLGRIEDFELPRRHLRQLEVTLVAPHLKSVAQAVDMLLAHGLFLSQIKVLYNGKAQFANVYLEKAGDQVVVRWVYPEADGAASGPDWSVQPLDLGTIFLKQVTGETRLTEATCVLDSVQD